jgi:hypothetical protein
MMARTSPDPYSDFVVRVMNSARIAMAQGDSMSQGEYEIVEAVRQSLLDLDPHAAHCRRASVITGAGRTVGGDQ